MANHFIYIVMDSCRYDSYVRAKTPNIDRLGEVERRDVGVHRRVVLSRAGGTRGAARTGRGSRG